MTVQAVQKTVKTQKNALVRIDHVSQLITATIVLTSAPFKLLSCLTLLTFSG